MLFKLHMPGLKKVLNLAALPGILSGVFLFLMKSSRIRLVYIRFYPSIFSLISHFNVS